MILQLQAKVHGLGNLGVSTCTYPNLNDFKATFRIIIPSSRQAECPGKTNTRSVTSLLCLRACLLCSGNPTSSTLLFLRYARFYLVGWFDSIRRFAIHSLGLSVTCHALLDLAVLALFAC